MAHIDAIDISQWQGAINWGAVNVPIAVIKISGSDNGDYYDSRANANYYGAKATGKAVGMYHFAGGGDPLHEAEYFINGCRPLEQDDVFVLDWEIQHADPVGWCTAFVNRVHELTGVWPLIYMNGSTLNAYDWSPVRNNCGTWVAWYGRDPEGDLPVSGAYVMHQYTSTGSVPGIAGNVDMDAWYGSLDQFKKYGYQVSAPPTPTPLPEPPAPTPEPVPTLAPEPPPVVIPPAPTPIEAENNSLLKQILALLQSLIDKFTNIFK